MFPVLGTLLREFQWRQPFAYSIQISLGAELVGSFVILYIDGYWSSL
jgi:hypothetical protein